MHGAHPITAPPPTSDSGRSAASHSLTAMRAWASVSHASASASPVKMGDSITSAAGTAGRQANL